MTEADIEWIRCHRSLPEQYKYFRQDKPITEEEQQRWWRTLDHSKVRLFIVCDGKGKKVGYVGFNPFNQYAKKAEFGIFIVMEEQGKGYGVQALELLLRQGFTKFNLSTIYSDVLDYPGENRWAFYEAMGFEKYPPPCQTYHYMKQGQRISSIRFYMTKEMWETRNAKQGVDEGRLAATAANAGGAAVKAKARVGNRRASGKANVNKVSGENLRAD